jgi:hypothetical protein
MKKEVGMGGRNSSQFAQYAREISDMTTSAAAAADHRRRPCIDEQQPPESLSDVIAITAQQNLSSMKSTVDKTLQEMASTQLQLQHYKDFIEKKSLQRIQCVRDIKLHCCKCQGPHVSKPPFSHGKNYRRDPIHSQRQGDACKFLKRKKAELKWLDNTLGKYPVNHDRFEQQISRCETETAKRKDEMKEALANSLRLMDIVHDVALEGLY